MSVQRYYVLIVGGWRAADAVPEYYVTEAMGTTTGVMVSADPEAALARFQDLNLANEYAAWKNGQPAAGLTFTGCTFSPPLKPTPPDAGPFRAEWSCHSSRWEIHYRAQVRPGVLTLIKAFANDDHSWAVIAEADELAKQLNAEFAKDPYRTMNTAQKMARANQEPEPAP